VTVVQSHDHPMFRKVDIHGAFRHSEIISNVVERRINLERLRIDGDLEVDIKIHPHAVILTPDCDLDWDFRERVLDDDFTYEFGRDRYINKELPTILLCEVMEAAHLKRDASMNREIWKQVHRNRDQRYHFISNIPEEYDYEGKGLPELGIDFKRYFTISSGELYWQVHSKDCKRRSWLGSTYLEHFSQRFAAYMSRVALPHDYESLK